MARILLFLILCLSAKAQNLAVNPSFEQGNLRPSDWTLNGTPISGATGETYSVLRTTAGNYGTYTVTAVNAQGSTTSDSAEVTLP